jgi:hypothetical protein
MHFECEITKATDTLYIHVIIIAIPRQQWLRERASTLHLYVLFPSRNRYNASFTKYILYQDIPTITSNSNDNITCCYTQTTTFLSSNRWLYLNVIHTTRRCYLPQEGTITVTVHISFRRQVLNGNMNSLIDGNFLG